MEVAETLRLRRSPFVSETICGLSDVPCNATCNVDVVGYNTRSTVR